MGITPWDFIEVSDEQVKHDVRHWGKALCRYFTSGLI